MTAAAFLIAAVCVAAFDGPTWAWLALGVTGAVATLVEAVG